MWVLAALLVGGHRRAVGLSSRETLRAGRGDAGTVARSPSGWAGPADGRSSSGISAGALTISAIVDAAISDGENPARSARRRACRWSRGRGWGGNPQRCKSPRAVVIAGGLLLAMGMILNRARGLRFRAESAGARETAVTAVIIPAVGALLAGGVVVPRAAARALAEVCEAARRVHRHLVVFRLPAFPGRRHGVGHRESGISVRRALNCWEKSCFTSPIRCFS